MLSVMNGHKVIITFSGVYCIYTMSGWHSYLANALDLLSSMLELTFSLFLFLSLSLVFCVLLSVSFLIISYFLVYFSMCHIIINQLHSFFCVCLSVGGGYSVFFKLGISGTRGRCRGNGKIGIDSRYHWVTNGQFSIGYWRFLDCR